MARDLPDPASARARAEQWAAPGKPPLLFGGMAFKYGPDETLTGKRLASLSAAATQFLDVITTSGPGTGYAADPTKIATIRAAIADSPLAVASGIAAENIADNLPCADCFLAASGISRTFDELAPSAVSRLVAHVRRGERIANYAIRAPGVICASSGGVLRRCAGPASRSRFPHRSPPRPSECTSASGNANVAARSITSDGLR